MYEFELVLYSTLPPDSTIKVGFDVDTICLISLLRLFGLKFTHEVAQKDFSPTGRLPCIRVNEMLYGFDDCLPIVLKELKLPTPVSPTLALSSILEGPLQRAIDYELYYDENVYQKITQAQLAANHPFPLGLLIPIMERQQVIVRLLAFNPVLNAQSIYNLAFNGLSVFTDYLGDKPFLLGDSPSYLDARLFSYLHICYCLLSKMDTRLYKMLKGNDTLLRYHLRMFKKS